jgi:hypothetical protein
MKRLFWLLPVLIMLVVFGGLVVLTKGGGEPIVCTPEDAFRCFMGIELELLVMGNCILKKDAQDQTLKRDYSSAFDPD